MNLTKTAAAIVLAASITLTGVSSAGASDILHKLAAISHLKAQTAGEDLAPVADTVEKDKPKPKSLEQTRQSVRVQSNTLGASAFSR